MDTLANILYAFGIAFMIPMVFLAGVGFLWTVDEWVLKPIFGRTFMDIRWK